MLNMIEDICMFNSINDLVNIRPINSDTHLKTKKEVKVPDAGALSENKNITHTSNHLEALKASLRDIPEINEARVLYFKAEIESGSYQIHSDNIAKSMLNNVEMV